MIIGVPREIKASENRVGITPAGVKAFARNGHKVLIEEGAGLGSGIADAEYKKAGAEIISSAAGVWRSAEMILKIKEPLAQEFAFLREDLLLFTYLHLAAAHELAEALLLSKTVGIAYETVQTPTGALPLLAPMSEIAGRMSVLLGANYLAKYNNGEGVLLGGVPGVHPGRIVIVGGGVVGSNAAKIAMGLGARVVVLDSNAERLRYLDDIFGARCTTLASNEHNIAEEVAKADLLVGAVLIPGASAPKLVTEEMVKSMKRGSVIIDVAVDQGGSIETIDRVTTHDSPVYEKHGVIHYAVANMPGAFPNTATYALTNVTLPYALELANKGWKKACEENHSLALGLNTVCGNVVHEKVAESLGKTPLPLKKILAVQ